MRVWIASRARSFVFAFRGFSWLLQESNAKIHALATLGVVGLGFWTELNRLEWALVVLAMAAVWVSEAMNTALELMSDALMPEQHPLIGKAKDVAACAVLVAAIGAAVVGGLVFLPRLLRAMAAF
jgi:diacylglycerol kinase